VRMNARIINQTKCSISLMSQLLDNTTEIQICLSCCGKLQIYSLFSTFFPHYCRCSFPGLGPAPFDKNSGWVSSFFCFFFKCFCVFCAVQL